MSTLMGSRLTQRLSLTPRRAGPMVSGLLVVAEGVCVEAEVVEDTVCRIRTIT